MEAQVQGGARLITGERPGARLPFRYGTDSVRIARRRQRFLQNMNWLGG